MQVNERTGEFNRRRNKRIVNACRIAFEQIKPFAFQKPIEYLESTLDLSVDVTSSASGLIRIREVTPYLVDPIEYFNRRGRHKLTAQAVEQSAKSTLWKAGMICRQKFLPGPAGIIYQNAEVGLRVIRDSFLPLLRCDEEFSQALPKRHNEAPKDIKLPYSVIYLMTGDGEIISFPISVIVGDEINKWRRDKANRNKRKFKADEDYQVSRIKNMDSRLRTFRDSLRVLVCSPEGKKGPITTEFKQSSMGYYYDRCAGCGKLAFNTTLPEEYFRYDAEDGVVNADSIRLVCPECGFAHNEADHKAQITRGGAYIHEHPERFDRHAGFCWGALATQMPGIDWFEICTSIENARNSNSYEAQAYLANSIKGVDYSPTVLTGDKLNIIRKHALPDLPEELRRRFAAVYMGVDTQDVGYWWTVKAIDCNQNWYTLDYGFAWDDQSVIEAWNREYCGFRPMAGIIDEGGPRKPDVDALVNKLGTGFYKYKGEGTPRNDKYRVSADDDLLILARSRYYQKKMLYSIYSQDKTNNNYWFIVAEIKKTYLHQMAAFQPPPNEKDADFEDWIHSDRQHDLFDAEKMVFVLHDFAVDKFPADFWLNLFEGQQNQPEIVVIPPSRPMPAR